MQNAAIPFGEQVSHRQEASAVKVGAASSLVMPVGVTVLAVLMLAVVDAHDQKIVVSFHVIPLHI